MRWYPTRHLRKNHLHCSATYMPWRYTSVKQDSREKKNAPGEKLMPSRHWNYCMHGCWTNTLPAVYRRALSVRQWNIPSNGGTSSSFLHKRICWTQITIAWKIVFARSPSVGRIICSQGVMMRHSGLRCYTACSEPAKRRE